jgi:serine/threonine protein kinase
MTSSDFNERWKVERVLGKGAMGEVLLAIDQRLGRKVAIKRMLNREGATTQADERFFNEAKTVAALNHPNIVQIYDYGRSEDGPYLIMEYVEGVSLQEHCQSGRLPADEVLRLGLQICDGLAQAHASNIIHRDIKPANILLTRDGIPKLTDFGLAKPTDSELNMTAAGAVLGTPNYMSPEQVSGRDIDQRSDLFSFGVVLYEMLTGSNPFAGASLGEVFNKILNVPLPSLEQYGVERSGQFDPLFQKLMAKEADQRYLNPQALHEDLKQLQSDSLIDTSASLQATATFHTAQVAAVSPDSVAIETIVSKIRESDVLILSADVDNHPPMPGSEGWIAQFCSHIQVRLQQLSGHPLKVNFLSGLPKDDASLDQVISALESLPTLLSVLSPGFIVDSHLHSLVEHFSSKAESGQGLTIDNRSRLVKVTKTPVDKEEVPRLLQARLSGILDFAFYETDPNTGVWREFDERFGPDAHQKYYSRVYDLCQELWPIVKSLKQRTGELQTSVALAGETRTIFLAQTTSDLQPETEKIRRELIGRGHRVLPSKPLTLLGETLAEEVAECLNESSFAIHPVGQSYGIVPEGESESLVAIQNRLAAQHVGHSDLQRLVWIPKQLDIKDSRQQLFLEELKTKPELFAGAEIIQDHLPNLKEVLLDRLQPKQPKKPSPVTADGESLPRIYLICDERDEESVEPLEDYLFDQGLEVSLPAFGAEEDEAAEVHRENLLDADAVLVFYGAARHSWVDIKLRNLLKAKGYGRETDIAFQAVYVAPPMDRRKERYRSHTAEVIHGKDPFDGQVLDALIQAIKSP